MIKEIPSLPRRYRLNFLSKCNDNRLRQCGNEILVLFRKLESINCRRLLEPLRQINGSSYTIKTSGNLLNENGGGDRTRTCIAFRPAVFKTAALPLCDPSTYGKQYNVPMSQVSSRRSHTFHRQDAQTPRRQERLSSKIESRIATLDLNCTFRV